MLFRSWLSWEDASTNSASYQQFNGGKGATNSSQAVCTCTHGYGHSKHVASCSKHKGLPFFELWGSLILFHTCLALCKQEAADGGLFKGGKGPLPVGKGDTQQFLKDNSQASLIEKRRQQSWKHKCTGRPPLLVLAGCSRQRFPQRV